MITKFIQSTRAALVLAALLAWSSTVPAKADVRIGAPRTDPQQVELTSDPATGTIYAVARWPTSFTLNCSTDKGATWTETYVSTGATGDVDVAFFNGSVYVAAIGGSNDREAVLFRFDASGIADGWVRFVASTDFVGGEAIEDVAVASNAQGDASILAFAFIEEDGRLRVHLVDSAAPDTLTELSPTIASVQDAAAGLDIDFDATNDVLYLSYLSDSEVVHVAAWSGLLWTDTAPFPGYSGTDDRTRISADNGRQAVVFAHPFVEGDGAYLLTRDFAVSSSWGIGRELRPTPTGPYTSFDVSVEGDRGWALAYAEDSAVYDAILMAVKSGYGSGVWPFSTVVNFEDHQVGTTFALEFLDDACSGSYGLAYVTDGLDLYFTALYGGGLFCDGFESGDSGRWSAP
jgi:hypothetical protein